MAKRKRLTPAQPRYLDTPEPELETKSTFPLGVAVHRSSRSLPPISQVAGEASAAAALTELSETLAQARAAGRMVQELAIGDVDPGYLVRDRLFADEEELIALMESLRQRGQQTPIEVVDRGEGTVPRYGLISGWRRHSALARLQAEGRGPGHVLALIRVPQSSSDAYVAMVEENEIRVGLSYYERARIVVKALEGGVYSDPKTALQTLFENVSRAKRSKIKSFMSVVEALDGALRHPTAIGERLGLRLAQALAADGGLAERIRADLAAADQGRNPEDEQAVIEAALVFARPPAPPAPEAAAEAPPEEPRPGVVLTRRGGDCIVLKGAGVDDRLAADLAAWLAAREAGG